MSLAVKQALGGNVAHEVESERLKEILDPLLRKRVIGFSFNTLVLGYIGLAVGPTALMLTFEDKTTLTFTSGEPISINYKE